MTFAELQSQVFAGNFTATNNRLDDFLFAMLPADYYRVWRYLWRKTFGWKKTTDFILSRDFGDDCVVLNATRVSRILHFFHLVGLITYVPGKRRLPGQQGFASHITVLPDGLPDDAAISRLRDYAGAACFLEQEYEKQHRQKDKHFQLSSKVFCQRVQEIASGARFTRDNIANLRASRKTESAPHADRPGTESAPHAETGKD